MSLVDNVRAGNPAGAAGPSLARRASPGATITIYTRSLHAPTSVVADCEDCLSEHERARATRFGNALLRERYIVGRAALRTALGIELGVDPANVPIERGPRGRPQLANGPLDFNLSHTGDLALIGITREGRIGVDVERRDRLLNVEGISRKFMSARERSELATLDPDAARRRLLLAWTCKEAMSKATGDALSAPFSKLDVDSEARVLRDGPPPYRPDRWSLFVADVPDDYEGTIAIWRR